MKAVEVRNIKIGDGIPKICVPIVGITKEDIINEAKTFDNIPVDVVEWRVDWFESVFDIEKVKDVLEDLRQVLKDTPILFTFRTSKEGGEKAIEAADYAKLNKEIAATGNVDLVDVEAFTGDEVVKEIIEAAHACGVKVVASNHDFDKTPDKEDIVGRLRKMQDLGADIPKIAVMPQSKLDVLTLLLGTKYDKVQAFTERYKEDGIIWFIEACDLNVMGIRRALWQMEQAGWFGHVKGFLIGRPYCNGEEFLGLDQYEAVTGILGKYNVPIIMDLDIGHIPPAMPLICGSYAKVSSVGNDVEVEMEFN